MVSLDKVKDLKLPEDVVSQFTSKVDISEEELYRRLRSMMYNTTTLPQPQTNYSDLLGMNLTDLIGVRVAFYLVYIIIFLTGMTGNGLVICIVYRNRHMHTVTNIFITNLAISDMLQCAINVPFTPLSCLLPTWPFGAAMCHIFSLITALPVFVSTMTLTVIAIDRYIVIIFPLRQRISMSCTLFNIILIWLLSITMSLPLSVFVKLESDPYAPENFYCGENWSEHAIKELYTMLCMMLQFVLPFLIIAFCYLRVSLRLASRIRYKPCTSKRKEEIEVKRKKRLNRMLISMVIVFSFCWFPFNMIHITTDYIWRPLVDSNYYLFIFLIGHTVAMSSTCYNPFLYAWLNEAFRKEFKKILPCFNKESRERATTMSTTVGRGVSKAVQPVGGEGCTCNSSPTQGSATANTGGAAHLNGCPTCYGKETTDGCLLLNNQNEEGKADATPSDTFSANLMTSNKLDNFSPSGNEDAANSSSNLPRQNQHKLSDTCNPCELVPLRSYEDNSNDDAEGEVRV